VSRSDIGGETEEIQSLLTIEEVNSFFLDLDNNTNAPTNFQTSSMNANEPYGKDMLTEDKVNGEMVNTETDTDNEIAAFLSAYNKGDNSKNKISGPSPNTNTSFDENDASYFASYTQDTTNHVPLKVSSDSNVQSSAIITQQTPASFNNTSPIILSSTESPASNYTPNATLNVPVTPIAVVAMPMETPQNFCYYYNGNEISYHVQPAPITQEVLSSMAEDSIRNITLPVTDVTHGVVVQPQFFVEPVSSTVNDQGVLQSLSPTPATLKRKASTLDEQDGKNPSKTKKWRADKMEKINDKWTEINAEVQEVENINKDITGKVAVFHHKNPFYGRDPCLEYGLHTYIIDLEKECNERLKALNEDKPRDSVKRKATHLKDLNELLKDFKKIKEKKGQLACMLDKKISGA